MEAHVTSSEWNFRGKSALESRALLGTHAQPPEMIAYSPVSPKHPKTHHTLVAAFLVLMVIAVGAICCCCYQWEGQMRVQARPRSIGHSELTEDTQSSPNSRQNSEEFCGTNPRVTSVSVIMPGDDIPRFIAWTVPQGAPAASAIPKALQAIPAEPDLHSGKFAHNSVVALNSGIPGRVSG